THLADFACALETFRRGSGVTYDLVHSHYWLSGWVGGWAQDVWGVPHVAMFHTLGATKNTADVGEDEPELRIFTETEIVRSCRRVIAATRNEKEDLVRYYNAAPDAVGVVPCGVDLSLFRPVEKETARRKIGVDSTERIVLYVGRIVPLKGIERLLEAAAFLRRQMDLRILIVGGDNGLGSQPELERLKQVSQELGIADRVIFAGRVKHEELPYYYSAADVFVLPSYHESFGMAALESLACGTPVVAGRVGGLESIIQTEEAGRLLSDFSPDSFGQSISEVLVESHSRSRPAESIQESVVDFGWANIADAMVEQYEMALNNRTDAVS
ncbi:glycosyltransferase, partial [Thermodesulfobacteriota bacterium]